MIWMIERQSQPVKDYAAANENHTYRLMRVVKLCIWPPLAMSGNTLLRRSRKWAKRVRRQGKGQSIIRKRIARRAVPAIVRPSQAVGSQMVGTSKGSRRVGVWLKLLKSQLRARNSTLREWILHPMTSLGIFGISNTLAVTISTTPIIDG